MIVPTETLHDRQPITPQTSVPRLGQKAWFGPHRIGWGLGPASIEGVATVIGFSVAASALRKRNGGERSPDGLFLFALFLLVVFLKGTSRCSQPIRLTSTIQVAPKLANLRPPSAGVDHVRNVANRQCRPPRRATAGVVARALALTALLTANGGGTS
jgi:hypothetical protein